MSVHTIRLEQGVVSTPAQPNQNPSIAQSPTQARGQSPIGISLDAAIIIQSVQQVTDGTLSNIGFVTGNYEAQEKAEGIVTAIGIGGALIKSPVITSIAITIKTGFDVYKVNKTQQKNAYKQSQAQVVTGKIITSRGVYV